MSVWTFIAIIISFFVGYFFRDVTYEESLETEKHEEDEKNEKEQEERQKLIQKSFEELMDYDYNRALRGDKRG